MKVSIQGILDRLEPVLRVPQVDIPEPHRVDLPGRGELWITDTGAPEGRPDAPTVILLHAVGCTGMLTWFPVVGELAEHFRVVTFDQRWHGRGIVSDEFALRDCADDVAALIDQLALDRPIVVGYSMGGVIAQRVWRQHPDSIGGLVLAATADHFRQRGYEIVFLQGVEVAMTGLRRLTTARVRRASQARVRRALETLPSPVNMWALNQWRATSPWALAQALAAIGRHNSRPWLGQVDVPTAVVITGRDHLIPPGRQRAMASRIQGAHVHDAACGHAGCVLQSEAFNPALLAAVDDVAARISSVAV
ncbi:pimeloyl-ACP methyl ester carboxylesterase [Nocardioides albertanoniae]|uniref:Pimeloyl-ACP methyl ester carboxylesterase n=1 Tax=Nocardioides albertanoniae TaxID=1175486 RepID=A0A543A768_9ACTN|nr:alpha/beta hydrolase [Nocardioides albertanoniae]TQL68453.1 pimeloyl-ACP methyl ester carboxylesterase [Nocardioides albertanoniae]